MAYNTWLIVLGVITIWINGGAAMGDDVVWKIERHNGVMTVFRNDQPVILNLLYNNDRWMPRLSGYAMAPIAKQTGIHTYMMHATVSWPSGEQATPEVRLQVEQHGTTTFEQLEARIEELFERDPDAHILWRIVFRAPQSWRDKYPDEMYQNESGDSPNSYFSPTSYGSTRFMDQARVGVREVVRHLEAHPRRDRFIGYYPMTGYSGEWNRGNNSPSHIADYAPVNQQAFRAYLRERYGDVTRLDNHLGTPFRSFDEIRIPSEEAFLGTTGHFLASADETLDRLYLRYENHRMAEWITTLCGDIKSVAPDKLSGVAFGYWFGQAQGGVRGLTRAVHLAWEEVASSPHIDFFLSPPIYWLAGPNHPMRFHTLLGSVDAYDKMFLAESDQPTHLVLRLPEVQAVPLLWTYKLAESNANLEELYRTRDERKKQLSLDERYGPDYGRNYQSEFVEAEDEGSALINQPSARTPGTMDESVANIMRLGTSIVCQPIGGLWWWDMEGCVRGSEGGIAYNHPKITATMARVVELFDAATKWNRTPRVEVLVVYSRDSILYAAGAREGWDAFKGSLQDNLEPLGRFGAPYLDVYLEDIERMPRSLLEQVRLVLFVNTWYVPSDTRRWIEENLKNRQRTLVWFYGSGYLGDTNSGGAAVTDLTEIEVLEKDRKEVLGCRITNTDHAITRGWAVQDETFGDVDRMIEPHLVVSDDKAEILGVSFRRREPVFAVKRLGEWTSVYLPGGPVPDHLLRALLADADGHLYTDQPGVQTWATRSCVGLYALSSKFEGKIMLPNEYAGTRVREWFTGQVLNVASNGVVQGEIDGRCALLLLMQ